MKNSFFFIAALLMTVTFCSTSCHDDMTSDEIIPQLSVEKINSRAQGPVRRAYHDDFDTWYQFVPDIANGWIPEFGPFLAWYPGGGEGHATQMGNARTYFNQYAPFTPPNIATVPAPVTMFFAAELAAAGITGMPDAVSFITFDDKGNSVWFHQLSNVAVPISPTRVNFSGEASIIGGSGKFTGATGLVTLHGYFNPQDQQDAGVGTDGWIEY